MIHSGGATLFGQPGGVKFTVTSAPAGRWSDPYITVGYDVSLNSALCNSRVLPGTDGKYGKSYVGTGPPRPDRPHPGVGARRDLR